MQTLKITLNNDEYKGIIDIDSHDFAIYNINQGRYQLKIESIYYETTVLILDVNDNVKAYILD